MGEPAVEFAHRAQPGGTARPSDAGRARLCEAGRSADFRPAGAGREIVAARGGGRARRLHHAGARGGVAAGRRQGAGGDAEPRGARSPDVGGAISRPDEGADRHRGPCRRAGRRCTATAATSWRSRAPKKRCGPKAWRRVPDLPRAVELNKTFHFAVYEAAQSPILVEIIRAPLAESRPRDQSRSAAPTPNGWRRATRSGAMPRCATRSKPATAQRAQAGIAADIRSAADFILSRGGACRLTFPSKRHLGVIMDLELKGLRVLVTAGANGIGLAIARRFAAEGARGAHLRCR